MRTEDYIKTVIKEALKEFKEEEKEKEMETRQCAYCKTITDNQPSIFLHDVCYDILHRIRKLKEWTPSPTELRHM